MNAAVGAAAADVQVTDWMYAALPTQIVNELLARQLQVVSFQVKWTSPKIPKH